MADGLCRMGVLPEPLTPEAFARHTGLRLDTAVRLAAGSRPVSRVALCSGSGGDFLSLCAGEADAFVTGEIKHHEWLRAAGSGLTVVEAGHYATEAAAADTLTAWLTARFPGLICRSFRGRPPYATVIPQNH